ncbi:Transglutaminase-like superfamily protein [Geodermatophilus ruber]|uniref:Transglutaminase-like superfamily protein n=2 Tax=Geodermatophilus ruber TaxID=504800 RepID=A0A1I4BIS8_9ACTN|nr:Transglutaminase-like superfamily protein [Geodermatophilus ruber]
MTATSAASTGSARRRVRIDGLRLAECLLGLLAVVLAAATFGAFYDGLRWLPWLAGAAVAGGALVGLCLLAGWRWWTGTVAVTAVLVLLAHAAGYGALSWFGLPTPASLRAFGSGLATGLPKMLAVGLPANFDDDLVVLPVLVVGAAGAGTVALLLRTRRTAPVVLPALLVLVLGLALTAARGGARVLLTGAFVLVVLGLLVLRGNRVSVAEGEGISEADADAVGLDLPARRRRSTYGRLALGLPVVAVVTAVALAGAWFLPIAPGDDRVDPRSLYRAPVEVNAVLSPLVEVRPQQLAQPDDPLFTVTVLDDSDPPLDRLRVAALDRFDGSLWTRARGFQVTGTTLPDPEALPSEASQVRLRVGVSSLPQPFLPVVGEPLRFAGTDFAFDRATGTVVSTRADVAGFGYSVTAAVRPLDRAALDVEPSRTRADEDYTRLPAKPPWVDTLTTDLIDPAESPLHQLLQIETFLQGRQYNRQAAPGHSYGALARTLGTSDAVGSSEQFASAFAVLARAAGYPARVAVGYLLRPSDRDGDSYRVSTGDAYAWAEVHLQGYGWATFEPTPPTEVATPPRSTDVNLEATEAAPPPTGSGNGNDGTGGASGTSPAEQVRLVAVVAGAAGCALLVGIVLLKRLRRLRRHRSGSPAQRVVGAWREVAGRLAEAGARVPASHTAGEVARDLLGSPAAPVSRHVAELAPLVAGAVFAYDEPDEATVARAWTLEHRIRHELGTALPVAARLRALVDPRPLFPRRRPKVRRPHQGPPDVRSRAAVG